METEAKQGKEFLMYGYAQHWSSNKKEYNQPYFFNRSP